MLVACVGGVLRGNTLDLRDEIHRSSMISPCCGNGQTHPDHLAILADITLHELIPSNVGRCESTILLDLCLEVVRMGDATGAQRLKLILRKAKHSAQSAVRLNDA